MVLFASLAALTGQEIPDSLDSRNTLDTFLGKSDEGRDGLVLGSNGRLSYRLGDWHLIPPYEGPKRNTPNIELGNSCTWSLYLQSEDIHEDVNLAGKYPDKVREMRDSLSRITGECYR